jgi:hypothetical protein
MSAQLQWFIPLVFVAGWSIVCGLLSYLSGWRSLSQRFSETIQIEGDRFRFASAGMGVIAWFPVNYSNCLFLTVGRAGISISLLFIFRILSPTLYIPWSQVQSVEEKRGLLGRRIIVYLRDSAIKITWFGRAGKRVLEAFADCGQRSI